MKKKYEWSLILAVVGGILATKTATITAIAVLEGCAVGRDWFYCRLVP